MACPDGLMCNGAKMCSEGGAACNDVDPADGGRVGDIDADPTDHTPPIVTIAPLGGFGGQGPHVSISWAVDEPNTTLDCTIDTHPTSCTGTVWTHNVNEGQHTFTMTARDISGNVSDPASLQFTVLCAGLNQRPTQVAGVLSFEDGPDSQVYSNPIAGGTSASAGSSLSVDMYDPLQNATGRFGRSVGFANAVKYVNWPLGLSGLTAFTLDFWLQPGANAAPKDQTVISNGNDNVQIVIPAGTAKLRFSLTGGSAPSVITSADLVPGQWNFVTASWNGNTMKLFVNGAVPVSTGFAFPMGFTFLPLYAGPHAGTNGLDANMDELVFATAGTTDTQALDRWCPVTTTP